MQSKNDHYQAISCEMHSQYELAIMHKNKLELSWLSEGELVSETNILLLDEPTNHLDAESVAWLERHLQEDKGTVIAVTHDREGCVLAQTMFAMDAGATKQEILEAYLNQINFDGVYGVQNASRHYFGKDVQQLNLPELS